MLDIKDIYGVYLQKLNEDNRINRYEDKEHWFHASSSGMCMRKIYYNSIEQVDSSPIDDNTTFREYKYSADNLNKFTAFQLKVVMKGTISSYPPRVKDLRGIALAV